MTGRNLRTRKNIRLRTQKCEIVCKKKCIIISISLIHIVAHVRWHYEKPRLVMKNRLSACYFIPFSFCLTCRVGSRVINNNCVFYRRTLLRARFRAGEEMRIGFTMIPISRTASGVGTSAGCELSLVKRDNNNEWYVRFSRTSWYIIPRRSVIVIHRDASLMYL